MRPRTSLRYNLQLWPSDRSRYWLYGHFRSILADWTQMQIARKVFSTCALACIKISAIFFYRRIFCVSGNKSGFSIVTLATVLIVFLWLVTFLFLTGFQCGSHFSALCNGTYLQCCKISFPFLYGLLISDLLLDVWIFALPVSQVSCLIATCIYHT